MKVWIKITVKSKGRIQFSSFFLYLMLSVGFCSLIFGHKTGSIGTLASKKHKRKECGFPPEG